MGCPRKTFLFDNSPGQQWSQDEAMIKYKDHARGKVRMPNKLVKIGLKCGAAAALAVATCAPFRFMRVGLWIQ